MKKTLSILLCGILAAGLFAGCTGDSTSSGSSSSTASTASSAAGSESSSGGEATSARPANHFRELYGGEVDTLNYLSSGNRNVHEMAANMVDCLVENDTYGLTVPALAESWEHNADYSVWTFKIRQGVKWLDTDGNEVAEVTAKDWVDAAKYVNTAEYDSGLQYMYDGIVKNAQTYYEQTAAELEANNKVTEGEAESVEAYYAENEIDPASFIPWEDVGVKALDDYTLEYTMESPCPFFLSVLSYASYMPAYGPYLESYGVNFGVDNYSILYNGAYILSTFEPQRTRILTKNPAYWDADKVYIETVEHIYNAQNTTLAPTMFQRGEVDFAVIGNDILDEWLANAETKDMVRPSTVDVDFSYFFAFNFEPRFDSVHEPDNWTIAVNNENFRKSIMAGLDRIKALSVTDAENPQLLTTNTVTPANFAIGGGKDFTQYDALKPYTDGDSFDEAKAKEYRDAARTELEAAGATFPIKILMPYNPVITDWDLECQVIEQQLEALLGNDFIDIVVEAGASNNFLSEVRRTGKFALMKCNWGADYADPQTWTDPFGSSNSYNFMYTNADKVLSDVPATNKTPETQAIVTEYYRLVDAAKAIVTDEAARYDAFAKAEAYLLDHAIVIPYSVSSDGYVADMRNPYDKQYAPYGMSPLKYKGRKLLDAPMGTDAYEAAKAQWETERAAALAAAQ